MSLLSNSPPNGAHDGALASDSRLILLKDWLVSLDLADPASARPASADASFRRYFRVDVLPAHRQAHGDTLIVMDAPPERENVPAFVKVDALFAAAGVSVPAIVAQDLERGFLLLQDLGVSTYLQVLDHDNASTMYAEALEALVKIQKALSLIHI